MRTSLVVFLACTLLTAGALAKDNKGKGKGKGPSQPPAGKPNVPQPSHPPSTDGQKPQLPPGLNAVLLHPSAQDMTTCAGVLRLNGTFFLNTTADGNCTRGGHLYNGNCYAPCPANWTWAMDTDTDIITCTTAACPNNTALCGRYCMAMELTVAIGDACDAVSDALDQYAPLKPCTPLELPGGMGMVPPGEDGSDSQGEDTNGDGSSTDGSSGSSEDDQGDGSSTGTQTAPVPGSQKPSTPPAGGKGSGKGSGSGSNGKGHSKGKGHSRMLRAMV